MRTAKYGVVLLVIAAGLIWAAAALAVDALSGPYSGATSQSGSSVSFTVTANTSVDDFEAEMSATCTNGSESHEIDVTLTPTSRISIHQPQSEFNFVGGFVLHNGAAVIGHGKGRVNGSFNSEGNATGTLRFPWEYFGNAGLLSGYHCDTGKVTFQASLSSKTKNGPSTAKCIVPKLKRKKLKAAKRAIRRGNCRVGRVVKRHSKIKRGRVIMQRPRPGTRLALGQRVKLIVSSGPGR